MINIQLLEELYDKHCKTGFTYTYGTAGFRYKADVLDTVMFTTGILAAIRSIYLKGQYVGVMITASHNPPQDNGVKIVDPKGEMLDQAWEPFATELANSASKGKQELIKALDKLITKLGIDDTESAKITISRDSRESGPRLLQAVIDGTKVLKNVQVVDFNLLTTPQLHFLTYQYNQGSSSKVEESTYYSAFSSAWTKICDLHDINSLPYRVIIDAANGIGGPKVSEMLLKNKFFSSTVSVINNQWQSPELLNESCGADYVKTNQRFPKGVSGNSENECIYCSFDGDADRIVFYYHDEKSKFNLLDGDKISTLFAKFFKELLVAAGAENELKLGVVQTAYANGSSTEYLSSILEVPVSCTATGVKHLHHEAIHNYDIGIYFEANGHGTVIFSDEFHKTIDKKLKEPQDDKTAKALKTLYLFTNLINQTVGDAISDMLAVLAVLCILKWSPQKWDQEYTDLPNKLVKVIVPDRSVFKTSNAERQLVSPKGLQEKIDSTVQEFEHGRSFVRASGTEDAVRVYAEAATKEKADRLAARVSDLVSRSVS